MSSCCSIQCLVVAKVVSGGELDILFAVNAADDVFADGRRSSSIYRYCIPMSSRVEIYYEFCRV